MFLADLAEKVVVDVVSVKTITSTNATTGRNLPSIARKAEMREHRVTKQPPFRQRLTQLMVVERDESF
jgi:hypothetical protein